MFFSAAPLFPSLSQNDKPQGFWEDSTQDNWASPDVYLLDPNELPQKIPTLVPDLQALPSPTHSSCSWYYIPRLLIFPAHLERALASTFLIWWLQTYSLFKKKKKKKSESFLWKNLPNNALQ